MTVLVVLQNIAADIGAWCGLVCFLASVLLRIIPTPLRVRGRWYRRLYTLLRWLAVNKGWKVNR